MQHSFIIQILSELEIERKFLNWIKNIYMKPRANIILFIKGDWNAKEGSQETPGVTGKFGLGVQNEAGQRLIEFCQENALLIAITLFQ